MKQALKIISFFLFLIFYTALNASLPLEKPKRMLRPNFTELCPQDFEGLRSLFAPEEHCNPHLFKEIRTKISGVYEIFSFYSRTYTTAELASDSQDPRLTRLKTNLESLEKVKHHLENLLTYLENQSDLYPQFPSHFEKIYNPLLLKVQTREEFLRKLLNFPRFIEDFKVRISQRILKNPSIIEEFILAWNLCSFDKYHLMQWAEAFKRDKHLTNIGFEDALSFYIWLDTLFKKYKEIELSLEEDEFNFYFWLETLSPSPILREKEELIKKCLQPYEDYIENPCKVYFLEDGTAFAYSAEDLDHRLQTYRYVITHEGHLFIQRRGAHLDILKGAPV